MPAVTGRRADGRGVDVVADRRRGDGGRDPQREATRSDRDHVTGTDLDSPDLVDDRRRPVGRHHLDRCPAGQLDDPHRAVDEEQAVVELHRRVVEVHRHRRRPADAVAARRQRHPWRAGRTGDDRRLERARPLGRVGASRRPAGRHHPGTLDERVDLDEGRQTRDDDTADLETERSGDPQRIGEVGDRVTRRADLDPDAPVVAVDHLDGWDGMWFHTTEWMPSPRLRKTGPDLVL